MSVLLIHPPLAKACEPPAGLAKLAAALNRHGVAFRVFDANVFALEDLLRTPVSAGDTWTRRADKHLERHLAALKAPPLYRNRDAYKRAVSDVNRLLHMAGRDKGKHLTLSNYSDPDLSPNRSVDLLDSARKFKENPFYGCFEKRLTDLFNEDRPKIAAISISFQSQALSGFAIAGLIRHRWPETIIVLGGGLVSSWSRNTGGNLAFEGLVDEWVAGPGEDALLTLCGKKGTGEMDSAAFDYSGFPFDRYLSPGPVLPYSTARGCYWRKCAFCPERAEKAGYRPYSEAEVLEDIGRQIERVHPVLIHFLDNALSPGFLNALIRRPPGVPWYGFVRITRHLADPNFVAGLKAAGCIMLKLGVESGDQGVLDALDKGISLETVSAALENLKKEGIATYVYLLFGTPEEDCDAAEKTLTYTLAHAGAIDFLNLAIFNLPAHGEEAQTLVTKNFYPGDLSLYRSFIHPKGWNRDKVRRFLSRKFTKEAPIRAILENDAPFFTSNHAPFFTQGFKASRIRGGK